MTAWNRFTELLGGDTVAAVDAIFFILCAISTFICAVLAAMLLVWGVRYRASSTVRRPKQLPVTRIELTWISLTLVLFLAIGVWGNMAFLNQRRPVRAAYTVYVEGKQWMWKIEHPSGRREINELHIPVGQPVRIVLSSSDVIHSFFLPHFRVKQDAVPGRYTSLWISPKEPSVSHLFCAEYCGTEHSQMIGRVVAMPADEFGRWLADRPLTERTPGMPGTETPLQIRGESLFYHAGCSACHVRDSAVFAPRLDGLWDRPTKLNNGRIVTVDEAYIRESIIDPNAKIAAGYPAPSNMPSYFGTLDDQQIRELIEFIRSIRHGWPEASLSPDAVAAPGNAQGRQPAIGDSP